MMRKLWESMKCFVSALGQGQGQAATRHDNGGAGRQSGSIPYSQPGSSQQEGEMAGVGEASGGILMPVSCVGQRKLDSSEASDLVQTWEASQQNSMAYSGNPWLQNTSNGNETCSLEQSMMNYCSELEQFHGRGICDVNAVDEGGRSALHVAATQNNAALVAGLLQANADPDKSDISGDTPLIIAAAHGKLPIVELLTSAGCDLDLRTCEGRTALMEAVMVRAIDVVRHLVSCRCHVNVLDSHGYTALSDAVQCGIKECVDVLLDGGADANVQDSRGRTPLHIAVLLGHTDIAHRLMETGSRINVQDVDGFSPVYLAAWDPWQKNTLTILRSLCNQGAALNTPDIQGAAPLTKAQAHTHISTLIQHGCDVNCRLNMGLTLPEFYALRQKWDIVQALLSAGFDRNLIVSKPMRDTSGEKRITYLALHSMCSEPASLRDMCRLAVRACLKRPLLKNTELLPLPRIIREYVAMTNILSPYS